MERDIKNGNVIGFNRGSKGTKDMKIKIVWKLRGRGRMEMWMTLNNDSQGTNDMKKEQKI